MEKLLPKGWTVHKVGELYYFVGGGTPSKSNKAYWNGDIPWASIKDISKIEELNETQDFISADGLDNSSANIAEKGEVILGTRMLPGKVVITRITTAINQDLKIVRNMVGIPSGFTYYLFRFLRSQFEDLAFGTTVKGITIEKLREVNFSLPPLAEQERIVAKLDKLFAQHEKIKAALDRIPELLKAFRQQVLTQAVTGKLTEQWREGKELEDGDIFIKKVIDDRNENDRTLKRKISFESIKGSYEIPDKWCFSFLQNLGEFTRGKSKHRPRNDKRLFNGIYPFIQTGDVSNATMYINEYKNTYSEFGLKQSRLFPKGTLCITIAANIAETAILNFDSCFPDSVVGYIPYKNLYSSEFAMYYINTIQKQLEHFAPATAQKNINMAILTEIPFPIPPLQEQKEITRRVESIFAKADTIEVRYQELRGKVDTLPQAILYKAFKGELAPQLPTDGDAKELLQEIMALKKETKGKKK